MTFIRTLIVLFISKNYKLKYLFAMNVFKTLYTSYTQIVSKRFSNKPICHCVWQKIFVYMPFVTVCLNSCHSFCQLLFISLFVCSRCIYLKVYCGFVFF